ncbi:MAG TPA: hypothetical protein DEQ98_14865, partial [Acidobacteria bacterium]|nr:hypothetical protein [Acidobacteriota bacterium]
MDVRLRADTRYGARRCSERVTSGVDECCRRHPIIARVARAVRRACRGASDPTFEAFPACDPGIDCDERPGDRRRDPGEGGEDVEYYDRRVAGRGWAALELVGGKAGSRRRGVRTHGVRLRQRTGPGPCVARVVWQALFRVPSGRGPDMSFSLSEDHLSHRGDRGRLLRGDRLLAWFGLRGVRCGGEPAGHRPGSSRPGDDDAWQERHHAWAGFRGPIGARRRGNAGPHRRQGSMTMAWRFVGATVVALLSASSGAVAQSGEWRAYSADLAGSKYSALDQITAGNAGELRIVWRQSTIPDAIRQGSDIRPPAVVQNTPLMADGRLYVSTGLGTVAALDAATGEVAWFDPLPDGVTSRGGASRGVAYWDDPESDDARVIAVIGSTLVALNARTGARYPDFGTGGEVDLTQGYDTRPVTAFRWRSAPLVVNGVVIVGSYGTDFTNDTQPARKEMPPGDVRGFDVRTGTQLWIFHTVPQEGEVGNETWLTSPSEDRASWEYTGNTNMWAWPSGDEDLGLVYLPLSTPTNDYYGGHRPGNNLFAESLVCLDARTGELVWHFQAVHHGVWDYDFPAAPNLVDITVDGRDIKAVALVSKQGFTYVFDRATGEPVWPIEERPV